MDKLPQEIIDGIFKALRSSDPTGSNALAFSKVCKTFRNSTQQFLFTSVRVPVNKRDKKEQTQSVLQYLASGNRPAIKHINLSSPLSEDRSGRGTPECRALFKKLGQVLPALDTLESFRSDFSWRDTFVLRLCVYAPPRCQLYLRYRDDDDRTDDNLPRGAFAELPFLYHATFLDLGEMNDRVSYTEFPGQPGHRHVGRVYDNLVSRFKNLQGLDIGYVALYLMLQYVKRQSQSLSSDGLECSNIQLKSLSVCPRRASTADITEWSEVSPILSLYWVEKMAVTVSRFSQWIFQHPSYFHCLRSLYVDFGHSRMVPGGEVNFVNELYNFICTKKLVELHIYGCPIGLPDTWSLSTWGSKLKVYVQSLMHVKLDATDCFFPPVRYDLTGMVGRCFFTPDDIAAIAEACPELETLGIDLPCCTETKWMSTEFSLGSTAPPSEDEYPVKILEESNFSALVSMRNLERLEIRLLSQLRLDQQQLDPYAVQIFLRRFSRRKVGRPLKSLFIAEVDDMSHFPHQYSCWKAEIQGSLVMMERTCLERVKDRRAQRDSVHHLSGPMRLNMESRFYLD